MKPLLLCIIPLALSFFAPRLQASKEGPLSSYFPGADSVYLVKVVSVDKDKVVFSITEPLRGPAITTLTLKPEFDLTFKKDSEYVILSALGWRTGQRGGLVGSFMKGDIGWIYSPVERDGKDVYVYGNAMENGRFVNDKPADDHGWGWLTLDHFKRLLQTTPLKP